MRSPGVPRHDGGVEAGAAGRNAGAGTGPAAGRAAVLDSRTPADHDRVVDLVRAAAILGVVVGHWLIDELYLSGGMLAERSNLAQVPALWPLTWVFMVLPLFFFVGGFSNMLSWDTTRRSGLGYASFLVRRTHRLLTPTLLYLAFVFAFAVLAEAVPAVGAAVPWMTASLLTQPLWFLGIYLVVIALAPVTLAAHRRFGVGALAVLVAVVVVVDAARVVGDMTVVGFANVLLVWLVVHQFGYFYADGRLGVGTGVLLAGAGFAALCALVVWGGYPVRMVGVPGDDVSNAYPPNLAMLSLGVAQIGVVVALRPRLAALLRRPRLWLAVVAVNTVIMSLYLWHQVAHILAAAVLLPLGYPVPPAGTAAWWAATLGMVGCSALVLAVIVPLVRPAEHRGAPGPVARGTGPALLAGTAVPLAALGLLFIAGTPVTLLYRFTEVLGPIPGSPVLGLVLLLAAMGLLSLARRHHPRPGTTSSSE